MIFSALSISEQICSRFFCNSSNALAEFRKDQERVCNEGIAALQQQRDDAVRQKEEELRNSLKEEIEDTFGQVDVLMRDALAVFENKRKYQNIENK